MGENTKIEWCDHVFNPWRVRGDSRVVAAESAWKRVEKWDRDKCQTCNGHGVVKSWSGSLAGGSLAVDASDCPTCRGDDEYCESVFCGSLCDVFEDWEGQCLTSKREYANERYHMGTFTDYVGRVLRGGNNAVRLSHVRQRLFRLIDATRLTWLLLTKRPENIRPMWCAHVNTDGKPPSQLRRDNVWLGTSIACQEDAERNIPELLKCRDLCAGMFLSIEPLIGPVDLNRWLYVGEEGGWEYVGSRSHLIDQVIIGGESGPNARPCNIEWVRSIARQCEAAGVLCFVKQIGSNPVGIRFSIDDNGRPFCIENDSFRGGAKPLDKKGGDPAEWPPDLRKYRSLAWKGGA